MKLLILSCLFTVTATVDEADLRRFKHAFSPAVDEEQAPELRKKAIQGIAGEDSAEVAELLIDAYLIVENEASEGIERRRPALQRDEKNKVLNEWRPKIDAAREVQDALLARLLALRSPGAVAAVVDRALNQSRLPLSLRLELARRSKALNDDQLVGRSFPRTRSSEDLVVALAFAEGLGERAKVWSRSVLRALDHDEVAVREAAIRALKQIASPDSIEPLIDRLDEEEGKTQQLVAETLETLTRQPNGASAVAWRRWLEAEGEPYVTGQIELGGGQPSKPAASSASRYHSIPVDGESILYLIDKSLSMRQTLRGRKAGDDDETRWVRARDELIRVLGELPEHKTFNIVAFDGSLAQFAPKMVRATKGNVHRAQQWLREQELKFGTNMYDALERAFIIAGRGTFDRYYQSQVDTIFLLTDGRPYVGNKPDDKGRIVRAVKRWNALKQVRVHVIGLGNDVPRKFLRQIASDHEGTLILEKAGDS